MFLNNYLSIIFIINLNNFNVIQSLNNHHDESSANLSKLNILNTTVILNNIKANLSEMIQHNLKLFKRNVFYSKISSNEKLTIRSKPKPAHNSTDSPSNRPRFTSTKSSQIQFRPESYRCSNYTIPDCRNKTKLFREKIQSEFQKVNLETIDEPNIYNVEYNNSNMKNSMKIVDFDEAPHATINEVICSVMRANVRGLRRKDFQQNSFSQCIPKKKMFGKNTNYETCAIVSSAGSMINARLGKFIDDHEMVLRFNHAPTEGYAEDVGSKTTIRIVNSQVVSKPEFRFTESPMFQNITIGAWDPGKYNSTLNDWLTNPDFNLFTNYKKFMEKYPTSNFHLIDPRSIWKLWQTLESHTDFSIRKNPPSSGFIGIALLIPVCKSIDVIEYIPSTRLNGKCHYYSEELNSACTFGAWHPLAAEKLMALHMSTGDEFTIYQNGILNIRQPWNTKCK